MAQFGNTHFHPGLCELIELHDSFTQANTSLPLA